MHRRIYFNFVGLIMACVAVLAVSFGALFSRASQAHEKAAIRDKANLVAQLLNQGDFDGVENIVGVGTRLTLIDREGWVLLDSHAAADLTVNRDDRVEFAEAVVHGSGEIIRDSATLGAETFYYAIRLENGSVLRMSRRLYDLGEVFPAILPTLIVIAIAILSLAYFAAYRLTRNIIRPLTEVDFESENPDALYEELWPYVRKINRQKQEISGQLTALRTRAETIEAIISNMREGLVILDENGLVAAANKSVLEIFEIADVTDIWQKNIRHIHRETEFVQAVRRCLEGEHLELSFARSEKIYKAFLNPATPGAIIFFLDTTEQSKAETQRREFTANVSHELKTPLTTISALAEMIHNGMAQTDDIPKFVGKISAHTARLINIIDDIIRLSEFDESKVERDFAAFDIYELAQSVISALQEKAAEKSIVLELDAQPLQIKANRSLIDELMYNLIENGIKYNKENGRVTLKISEENNHCKIAVTDTGIGISAENQKRVFERFYRVDSSRSKKTGGTGLGLSIVKHVTEHHGGRIELESAEGEGTRVVCFVPVG